MGTPLRALLIEENDDAMLVERRLRQGGYELVCRRVETADQLQRALGEPWDVVLADYNLPAFNAPAALAILKQRQIDVPLIVVSGAVGEPTAVAIMRAGACDFFHKDDLGLLPTAVQREVAEAAVRRERRQAAARLRDEQLRYQALFQQSPDGVMLLDPHTLRAVEFNDAACMQLGYDRAEFAELSLEAYEATLPSHELRTRVDAMLHSPRCDFQSRLRTKSGELRDVLVTTQPLTLGGRSLLHAIVRDVTYLKRAEERLREGESRYLRLLSSVSNYTYTVTRHADGSIVTEHSPSSVAVTGYSPADYRADPNLWIKMVHPDDRERVRRHIAEIQARSDAPPLEHRILHRNGSLHWIRDTIVARRDGSGTISGYDGVIEDITDRKRVEDALHERDVQLLAARRIQERLLPTRAPAIAGFDVAGLSCPAALAGGDYFDYLPMLDGGWWFMIGDASGHRFASALLMASTRAYLRSLVQIHTSVAEILSLCNSILSTEVEEDHFVTLFLGRLNVRKRSLLYASAGHETGFILDSQGAVKARLESTGLPLAVLADEEYLPRDPIELRTGDIILLLTDGMRESFNRDGRSLGIDPVLNLVRRNADRPAQEIVAALCRQSIAHAGDTHAPDDVTALVIKVLT